MELTSPLLNVSMVFRHMDNCIVMHCNIDLALTLMNFD
jgi:hypothetical protein